MTTPSVRTILSAVADEIASLPVGARDEANRALRYAIQRIVQTAYARGLTWDECERLLKEYHRVTGL